MKQLRSLRNKDSVIVIISLPLKNKDYYVFKKH